MAEPNNPHDALFKHFFSKPENAADLFRAILPERLLAGIDFATLVAAPGSYVDDHLASSHSDLLFSVKLAGRPAFVYTLLEHQSSPDELMPLRLVKYMVRIWERHVDDQGKGKQALPLPFIVPVVVHHGEDGWTAATKLEALFDQALAEELELGPLLPRLEFLLDDLSLLTDDELMRRARDLAPSLALLALRDARSAARLEASRERAIGLFLGLLAAESGAEAFNVIFRYLYAVGDDSVVVTIYSSLAEHSLAKDALMTLQQRHEARGEERGEARGEAKAKIKAVLDVLDVRQIPLTPEQRARIEVCTDLALLDRWHRLAVTTSDASELFAAPS